MPFKLCTSTNNNFNPNKIHEIIQSINVIINQNYFKYK